MCRRSGSGPKCCPTPRRSSVAARSSMRSSRRNKSLPITPRPGETSQGAAKRAMLEELARADAERQTKLARKEEKKRRRAAGDESREQKSQEAPAPAAESQEDSVDRPSGPLPAVA